MVPRGWRLTNIFNHFFSAAHKYTSIATRNLIKTDATQSLSYYNIHKVTLTLTFLNIKVRKREVEVEGQPQQISKTLCRDLGTKVPQAAKYA